MNNGKDSTPYSLSSNSQSLRKQQTPGASKRFKAAFKSPMRSDGQAPAQSVDAVTTEIGKLEERVKELDASIAELVDEGIDENELQLYIDKLHTYNEIKDLGQMLIGKLALERKVTTKDLYADYGLNLED